jgi:gag-polypeptide of LTR copia-type
MADTYSLSASYPFSYQLSLKLNHSNYLSWKYLVLPYVRGHDLLRYLDGSRPAPPEMISTGANPTFKIWSRHDELLLAWLLGSISESVVSQVVHCSTYVDIWRELQLRFSTQSLACVMDIKMQFHSLQKGHLSMQDYLDQKRSLARLIGSPISNDDFITLHSSWIEC